MAISINKVSEEIKEKIIKDYLNNIYKDATIYLDRKYNKFQTFISKYTER